jgi:hypothetical protein
VLTHVCFDQRAGQSKPPHCGCGTHVSKKHAKHLVDSGQADYLLSSRIRNGLVQPYPTKQVIVLAQSAPEQEVIEMDRRHLAEARETEIQLKRAAKRQKQIAELREKLLKSFRHFLRTEVTQGHLGADCDLLLLDDARLILWLTTENKLLAEKLRPVAAANFTVLIHEWLELGFDEAGQGLYADGEPAGGRQRGTVTGGMGSAKLDTIDAQAQIADGDDGNALETGRYAKAKTPRGAAPDQYESD